jgi:hypothetical protein
MIDNDNHIPDVPANWEQYSKALRNVPERSMPPGLDGRLHAALSEPALRRHHRVALWRRLLVPTFTAATLVMIFWFGSAWQGENTSPQFQRTNVSTAPRVPKPAVKRQNRPAQPPVVTTPSQPDIAAVAADSVANASLPALDSTHPPTLPRPASTAPGTGPEPGR